MASGKSSLEAKVLATSTVLLPQLAQLKGLAQDMVGMQKQFAASGDTQSADAVAQWNLQLAQQLGSGEGAHVIIDNLVGMAIERMTLNQLDPNQRYEFLGSTPQERIAQLVTEKAEIKELTSKSLDLMEQATDSELMSYFDRLKLYGEMAALQWLSQRKA